MYDSKSIDDLENKWMHLLYRFWNLQRPIDILPGVSRRKIFQLYQISIVFETPISRSTDNNTIR